MPRKNILPLNGKPLLSYTIEAAQHAEVYKSIVVSSENDEILDLASSLEVTPDRRPFEVSGDTIRAVQVVYEYLSREGIRHEFDIVAQMLPTCPFRTSDDVRNAVNLFLKHKNEVFLTAVTEYDFSPQLAFMLDSDGKTLEMVDPAQYVQTTRSQDIRKCYHSNGAIYIAPVQGFLREKTFFVNPMLGYVMPAERSFDIDYMYQFRIAEHMMKEKT